MRVHELKKYGITMRFSRDREVLEQYKDAELICYAIVESPHTERVSYSAPREKKMIVGYAFIFRGDRDYFCYMNGMREEMEAVVAFINELKVHKEEVPQELMRQLVLRAL